MRERQGVSELELGVELPHDAGMHAEESAPGGELAGAQSIENVVSCICNYGSCSLSRFHMRPDGARIGETECSSRESIT